MKKIFIIALLTFTATANAQQAEMDTENIPQGWIKVHKDGFTGYIDDTGVEIVPAVYDEIGDFGTYCTDTAVIVQNGLMGLIDLQGAQLCKPQYETLLQSNKFPNGWIMVQKDGFYGFIDCEGQETVKPVYEAIEGAITNINKN
jgi:hypothetical protein